MERSAIRGSQPADSAPGFRFYKQNPDARHRLCSLSGPRKAGLLLSVSPSGACGTPGGSPRPRRQVCRHAIGTPGALCLKHRAAAAREEQTAGPPSIFASRRQPAPEAGTSPAFRTRMDFATCCMSRMAPFRRRVPVRVSCYPDMHLGRPPVAPVSSLEAVADLAIPQRRRPASLRPPQPAPRHEDTREAPLTGTYSPSSDRRQGTTRK
jgi:hypothetical protein